MVAQLLLLLLLFAFTNGDSFVFLDDGSFLDKDLSLTELEANVTELKYQRPTEAREKQRRGSSVGVKFRNFLRHKVEMYWDDGSEEGTYSGIVDGLGRTATMSYVGHSFFFKSGNEQVARFEILPRKHLYIIEPVDVEISKSKQYLETKREEKFMEEYEATTGSPWLSFYPRDVPTLFMWPAAIVGQQHVVSTSFGYDLSHTPIALKLRVLSHAPQGPRVFHVPELMSRGECDYVLKNARVAQSMVGQGGGFQSKTRTSSNGWMKRSESELLEHVFRRFGDVLGVDHSKLTPSKNAEELQVVKYNLNQEYAPHHDFGDDGTPNQRFLTLLLYVKVPERGGATSFPKAFNGKGFQVVPNVGDAILFYNMLPDGNADDLALHAGMPVTKGEKWVCNLWVWDPRRS